MKAPLTQGRPNHLPVINEPAALPAQRRELTRHDLAALARELVGKCRQARGVDVRLLQEGLGLSLDEARGGCCGLAGSWGFEAGKYVISQQCAEVGFLPAVRRADATTVIVADGFSCRTQLEQSRFERRALHVAELMRLGRNGSAAKSAVAHPELSSPGPPPARLALSLARAAAGVALAAATSTAVALFRALKRAR